jgi:hypothetical protein
MTESMLEIKARPEREPIHFKVDGNTYQFRDIEGIPLIERHGLVKMARRMAGVGDIGNLEVSDEEFEKSVGEIGALFSSLVIDSEKLNDQLTEDQKIQAIQYFFEQRMARAEPSKKKKTTKKKTASKSRADSSVSSAAV